MRIEGFAHILVDPIAETLTGHFIQLEGNSRFTWGLKAEKSLQVPKLHECCTSMNLSPVFWNVTLFHYDNNKTFTFENIQQNVNLGDNISLTSEFDEWVVNSNLEKEKRDFFFDFIAETLKVDEDAKVHVKKYNLDPQNLFSNNNDILVVIGKMKVEKFYV
ncbi:hypothetical protein HDU92_006532 [Lobulomyces angularis]|nr:hypothetical protein HDU92_006532 [Lobulomyces angularis]